MTVTQYIRYKNIDEIKKTLKILDNTPDALVEIQHGVLCFMNKVGHIRLVNMNTLREVNEEPLAISGILNNKIVLKLSKNWLDDIRKSIVVDLDTFETVLNVGESLDVVGDLIYTATSGIVQKESKEFKIYNCKGKVIYTRLVGYAMSIHRLCDSNIYAMTYTTSDLDDSSTYKSYKHIVILQYNNLTESCEELAHLNDNYTITPISSETAVVTKSSNSGEPLAATVINFRDIDLGSSKELDKIIYL